MKFVETKLICISLSISNVWLLPWGNTYKNQILKLIYVKINKKIIIIMIIIIIKKCVVNVNQLLFGKNRNNFGGFKKMNIYKINGHPTSLFFDTTVKFPK